MRHLTKVTIRNSGIQNSGAQNSDQYQRPEGSKPEGGGRKLRQGRRQQAPYLPDRGVNDDFLLFGPLEKAFWTKKCQLWITQVLLFSVFTKARRYLPWKFMKMRCLFLLFSMKKFMEDSSSGMGELRGWLARQNVGWLAMSFPCRRRLGVDHEILIHVSPQILTKD